MRTALALLLATGPVLVSAVADGAPCDVTVAAPGYSPGSFTVAPGATVTWCWTGDDHSVTGDGFDSGVRNSGATYAHTFARAGTYEYHCSTHPSMVASVTVAAEPTPPPPMSAPPFAEKAPATTAEAEPPPASMAALTALVGTAPPLTGFADPTVPAPVIAPPATTAAPQMSAAAVAPTSSRSSRPYVLGLLGGLVAVAGGYALSPRRHRRRRDG